ncbi:MAG: DUF493 domain-containing protein [Pseudomonadota bacterium]
MTNQNGNDTPPRVLSQANRLKALEETPLEYPVDFPIKVIGQDSDGAGSFRAIVLGILDRHFASVERSGVAERPSRGGKYTSITATVRADSKDQLDAAYAALTASDEVLWAL